MKTNFGDKFAKLAPYRQKTKRKQLREIKIIAEIVKLIIKNDSKILTNKDIKQISLKTYKKYDKISHIRVRNMTNSPEIKQQVNDKLLDYYIKQGIEPINKVFELTKKAEEVAKNTSDYMQIAKHYKEIAEIGPNNATITQRETIDYAAIADKDTDNPQLIEQKRTITRTVTQQITPDNSTK